MNWAWTITELKQHKLAPSGLFWLDLLFDPILESMLSCYCFDLISTTDQNNLNKIWNIGGFFEIMSIPRFHFDFRENPTFTLNVLILISLCKFFHLPILGSSWGACKSCSIYLWKMGRRRCIFEHLKRIGEMCVKGT